MKNFLLSGLILLLLNIISGSIVFAGGVTTSYLLIDENVHGLVVDSASGRSLSGATVQIEGTENGTTTNASGKFNIDAPSDAILIVSSIGYKTRRIPVNGKNTFKISLVKSSTNLDQLVVVGYEKQRKRDVTGAVSTINADELIMSSAPDIGHMLEGKLPGLYIKQNSAQPGGGLDLLVRGGGSINASNEPLIVIDGVPVTDAQLPGSGGYYDAGTFSVFNSINPNDVASITILKDASAAAIYGSRAANGVILVTTKRGKKGEMVVNYSANYSVQPYVNKFKMLPLKKWMEVYNQASWENWLWENNVQPWGSFTVAEAEADPVAGLYHPHFSQKAIDDVGQGTDWVKLVTRTGSTMQHNISVTGGGEKATYFISGNYYDQKGVVKNSELKRMSFRTNLDVTLSNALRLSTSLNLSRVNSYNTQLGDNQFEQSGILTMALNQGPDIKAIDEEGNYPLNPLTANNPNPLSMLTITDDGLVDKMKLNISLLINPIEHLNINLTGSIDNTSSKREKYVPTSTVHGNNLNGISNIGSIDNNHYLLQATADYKRTFGGEHNFDLLFGTSREDFHNKAANQNVSDFLTDAFLMYNMGAGTGPKSVSSSYSIGQIASFFGRFNYRFRGKYFFTFTMRADGSSVFADGNKWGYFPSVALAWNLSQEPFFQPIKNTVSQLKLRVSYGQTGNADIGTNAFASYYAHPAYLGSDDEIEIGVSPEKLANPNLTWETTTEKNIGLDYELFGGKVSGSLDFYHKVISNLLATKSLNSYMTINSVIANIGKTQSNGFGLEVTTVNMDRKHFSWRTRLSLSRFYNTWKERAEDWKPAPYEREHDPLNAMYYRRTDGILQVGDKVPISQPELKPGQIKIDDINGFLKDAHGDPAVDKNGRFILTGKTDGKIDQADYVMIGNGDPSLIGGIVNILKFRNFTLNIAFNAMFGRRIENQTYLLYGRNAYDIMQLDLNRMTTVLQRWRPDHPSKTRTSTYQDWSPYGDGDFYLQKAWFIRLQDVSLRYELPSSWFKGVFNHFSLHFSTNNLFWVSPYDGIDPETDVYAGAYPNMPTYNFGVDLKF